MPRAASAGLVLLGLVAIAGFVVLLVVHGISANSGDVSTQASAALDKIEGWLATIFVLKDAPVMSRVITRSLGLPVPGAVIVVQEIASGLRSDFTGVTIVAACNAVVVGLGALILGVPLAGTIAVVTFITAYVLFIGAWVAGSFRLRPRARFAGRDAEPESARRADSDHRRRRAARDGGPHARGAADVCRRAHQRGTQRTLGGRHRRPARG